MVLNIKLPSLTGNVLPGTITHKEKKLVPAEQVPVVFLKEELFPLPACRASVRLHMLVKHRGTSI